MDTKHSISRENMWQMLINSIINNITISNLNNIMGMIRKNLTFDDPGLFSSEVLVDKVDRAQEEVANSWLINQLIVSLSVNTTVSWKENLELQKEILSASIIKQPWLFGKLVQQYIKIVRDLVEVSSNEEDEGTYYFFIVEGYDLKKLSADCKFQPLKLKKDERQNKILKFVISILLHALSTGLDLYDNIFKECHQCVYSAFNYGHLSVKTKCVEYFTRFLFENDDFKFNELEVYVLLLQGYKAAMEKFPLWLENEAVRDNEIAAFMMNVQKFFGPLKELFKANGFSNISGRIFKASYELVVTVSSPKIRENIDYEGFYENFCETIVKYLCIILEKSSKNELKLLYPEKYLQNVQLAPNLLKIVDVIIVEDCKNVEASQVLEKYSNLWMEINGKLIEIVDNLEKEDENFLHKLKIIAEILHLKININHKYQVWHQRQHIEKTDSMPTTATNIITFSRPDEYRKFLNDFLKILQTRNTFDYSTYCLIIEILQFLLQNHEIRYVSNDLKIYLIDQIANCLLSQFRLTLKSKQFFQLENTEPQNHENLEIKTFKILLNLECQPLSTDVENYVKTIIEIIVKAVTRSEDKILFENCISEYLVNIISKELCNIKIVQDFIIKILSKMNNEKISSKFWSNIKSLLCLLNGNVKFLRNYKKTNFFYKIFCYDCEIMNDNRKWNGKNNETNPLKNILEINNDFTLLERKSKHYKDFINSNEFRIIFKFLTKKSQTEIAVQLTRALPSLIAHTNGFENRESLNAWLEILDHPSVDVRISFADQLQNVVKLLVKTQAISVQEEILDKCMRRTLNSAQNTLDSSEDKAMQSCMLNILSKFASVDGIPDRFLVNFFRLTFIFMIRYESGVAHEAVLAGTQICRFHNKTPRNMFNWYKRCIMKFLIRLSVSMYLRNGIGLNGALYHVTKLFGYSKSHDFIYQNYKLIVAMLLPWCLTYPKSLELLKEIGSIVQKDHSKLLSCSFLTAYAYLFTDENEEMQTKCIDFIVKNTGKTLNDLLKLDITGTLTEILIHYHKNPTCVMKAFRGLMSEANTAMSSSETNTIPHEKVVGFVSPRFLGVLTYFETCLIDPDFERELKVEAILSLGELIRFIGIKSITPFRFKILAMLRTALTIDKPNLRNECAEVWKIFIHTVDIQTLGPLLSTIVASLEPLLCTNPEQVNAILKFLVSSNASLLSVHIPDLYFIKNLPVSREIQNIVEQHTERLKSGNSFVNKFEFFLSQVKNENLSVKAYALRYLTNLFANNRQNLNNLIMAQANIDPILVDVLEILMIGCRNVERNLQLWSGKCLGEIGAIEPSYLPPNYSPQTSFALSIHTDEFAIIALGELCRAYQYQKNTKHVDSLSLAIQEILLAREVSPKLSRKLNVWQAIPERLRPLMEPFLTSCYTGLPMTATITVHPIFGSSKCQTCEEWAFVWSYKMIQNIQNEETQQLLNSTRPSMKRDSNIMALFLPYIILHALQTSTTENIERIFEELNCVIVAISNRDNLSEESNNFSSSRLRGIKTLDFVLSKSLENSDNDSVDEVGIKCAKLAFEQFDFLERWLREWRRKYAGHTPDAPYKAIESFLTRFDNQSIAKANFNCGEYARALLYLEKYIDGDSSHRLQENLSFLAEIHAELMDPDSLEGGVGMKKTELTISEQILVNNMTDRFLESTACFEKLMQAGNISENHVRDIVQCYLSLDTPETALLVSEGLLNKLGAKYADQTLKEIQAEPLWRLGRWEELEKLVDSKSSQNWGVQCGQALLSFRTDEMSEFESKLDEINYSILKLFRSGGYEKNSYHKSYQHVMKLHLLTEIAKTKHLLEELIRNPSQTESQRILKEFFKNWKSRSALLQPNARTTEPVLCLRRILLSETKNILENKLKDSASRLGTLQETIKEEMGKLWIQSTELARKAGMFQVAQLCIMNAEQYQPENLFLEKAKLFWEKKDQTNSFLVIEQKINEIIDTRDISQALANLPRSRRLLYAEAKFLQATYNAKAMNISTDTNLKFFTQALNANQKSEKCCVHLAQYLEKIFNAMSETEQENSTGQDIQHEILLSYGKSMSFGCEYIYQSMPRMLSIWFDFTAKPKKDEYFKKISTKMNETVARFSEILPSFIFFTAFSQLVSRICHPSVEVYGVLKTIIVNLIQKFPQQSLWMILSVFKSSYVNRVKRCLEVFNDKRLSSPQMQKLIADFNLLAEKLIELTNKEIPSNVKKPTVSSLVQQLPKIFTDSKFSQIVLPFQQYMQPILPPIDERQSPANNFDAFPNKYIYIRGIKEEITILMSLQKPRKVNFIGSDGKEYTVMMKPKDDLRKDFRLMEFNAVVKQYLHQDPDARQRRLTIRTYAVVPLNEECGLIEWLHNLYALRTILNTFYKARGLGIGANAVKSYACAARDSIEKKRDIYLAKLLPPHPPLFSEWFKQSFTTPHNWYQARCSYVKTTAVMSIVGYILGLGDRHGENILFDGNNGDTVHVDFNCLFNKGEAFEIPERVPFRLTHNMVHAMGPLGVEGLFRKCSEIAMRVLQAQTPTLMSVLRPFVYDPLVTWSRCAGQKSEERTDPQAMNNINQIEERLNGYVKIKGRTTNMPLSPEGQVNFCIAQATSIDNLASMYIGWGPYL